MSAHEWEPIPFSLPENGSITIEVDPAKTAVANNMGVVVSFATYTSLFCHEYYDPSQGNYQTIASVEMTATPAGNAVLRQVTRDVKTTQDLKGPGPFTFDPALDRFFGEPAYGINVVCVLSYPQAVFLAEASAGAPQLDFSRMAFEIKTEMCDADGASARDTIVGRGAQAAARLEA